MKIQIRDLPEEIKVQSKTYEEKLKNKWLLLKSTKANMIQQYESLKLKHQLHKSMQLQSESLHTSLLGHEISYKEAELIRANKKFEIERLKLENFELKKTMVELYTQDNTLMNKLEQLKIDEDSAKQDVEDLKLHSMHTEVEITAARDINNSLLDNLISTCFLNIDLK